MIMMQFASARGIVLVEDCLNLLIELEFKKRAGYMRSGNNG